MLYLKIFISLTTLMSLSLVSASLSIRSIEPSKKSVYVEQAIYQAGDFSQRSKLSKIRHSNKSSKGYERVVLDFEGKTLPETYVFISSKDGKVNIDLSNTEIKKTVRPTINSNLIKEVNFFPLANDILSMEIFLDKKFHVEVFQLKSPTRLVIDIKK